MNPTTLSSPLVALALAAVLAPSAAAKSDDQKAEAPLIRPAGAPDSNAKGRVKVEHDTKKNRDKMDVEAENIDTSLTFELWVEDAGGTLQFIANMPVNGPGEVELEMDTHEDLPLPFGASQVKDLAGRALEVRSGGVAYLEGTVPDVGSGGSSGGSGSGSGGGDWIKVKSSMVRPAGAPDSNASGYVELRRRDKDSRQRFKVEADHVDPSVGFSVWLEDAVGSGVLANVGAMKQEESDEVELELDTGDGAQLPFGVADVDLLTGRVVEVRSGGGQVYLTGIVPALGGGSSSTQKTSSDLTATVGKGEIRLKSKPKAPFERLEIRVKKLAKKSGIEIWMRDPGTGTFAMVSGLTTNGGGNAKFKVQTKKGQPLPFGAANLDLLAGVDVEVRDATSGVVLQAGAVPSL